MAVVPSNLAQQCIDYYYEVMNGDDPGSIKDAISYSVTFKTPEFASWLRSNEYLENTTTIKISFGIYTEAVAEELNIPELAGRLTAFVVPEKEGETFDPYNTGTINP